MTLPRRIAKPTKRASRWRSQAHTTWVASHACSNCDSTEDVEAAHVRMRSGAGIGQKPDDFLTASLCHKCHHGIQHTIGEPSFWKDYTRRTGRTVWDLLSEFAAKSPKAAEIRAIQRERVNV